MMQTQQVLNFPDNPNYTFETFIPCDNNRAVLEAVQDIMTLSAVSMTLWGEAGTGKTHLLKAATQHLRRREADHSAALFLDIPCLKNLLSEGERALTLFLARHASCRLLVLDGLEALAHASTLQERILYLFNHARMSKRSRLLLAGRTSPKQMTGVRNDLISRLMSGPVFQLATPNDALLTSVVQKMARDRGFRISRDLLKFLIRRLPREIPLYRDILRQLDEAALKKKRSITIPFAKEILGETLCRLTTD